MKIKNDIKIFIAAVVSRMGERKEIKSPGIYENYVFLLSL